MESATTPTPTATLIRPERLNVTLGGSSSGDSLLHGLSDRRSRLTPDYYLARGVSRAPIESRLTRRDAMDNPTMIRRAVARGLASTLVLLATSPLVAC